MRYKILDNTIKVYLPFVQKEQLKDCGGVAWNKAEKCYDAPQNLDFIYKFIQSFQIVDPKLNVLYNKLYNEIQYLKQVIAYYKYLRENPTVPVPEPILSFPWKTYAPYRHQQLSLYVSIMMSRYGLFLDTGAGKSRVIIDTLCYRISQRQIKSILIVCPKINIRNTWLPQVEKHATCDIPMIPIYKGTTKKKRDLLTKRPDGVFAHVMTYAFMRTNLKYMSGYDAIVFDESRRLGDSQSKRSEAAFSLATRSKYTLLATGTVNTLGSFSDVFSQFKVLDFGKSFGLHFKNFQATYFRDIGRNFPKWVMKRGAIDIIHEIMYSKAVTYKKEECLDLPGQCFKYIKLEPEPEQLKFYNEVVDANLTEWIEKEFKLDYQIENAAFEDYVPLAKITKLLEVTSGFYKPITDEKNIVKFNTAKIPALLDIIDIIGNEKLVIWVRFSHDVEKVIEALEEKGVGCCRLTGQVDEIQKWVNSSANRVLVGIETMGIGLNDLIIARYVVYYSYDYSLDHWKQSIDRTYRIGQLRKVTYFVLMIVGTADIGVINALKNNERISDKLTSYKYRRLAIGEIN